MFNHNFFVDGNTLIYNGNGVDIQQGVDVLRIYSKDGDDAPVEVTDELSTIFSDIDNFKSQIVLTTLYKDDNYMKWYSNQVGLKMESPNANV